MIVDQLADRRTASSNRIAIASPDRPIGVRDAHHWRLLQFEALDCISAFYLRLQVDLQNFNGNDFVHQTISPVGMMVAGAAKRWRREVKASADAIRHELTR